MLLCLFGMFRIVDSVDENFALSSTICVGTLTSGGDVDLGIVDIRQGIYLFAILMRIGAFALVAESLAESPNIVLVNKFDDITIVSGYSEQRKCFDDETRTLNIIDSSFESRSF